jgi:hypothetical protein
MTENKEEKYDSKKRTITNYLPDGWCIEITLPTSWERARSFTLNKDGVCIAMGRDGSESFGQHNRYHMDITGYSIYDAKPIVDKIMYEYKSSVKKEQLEQEERIRINSDIASKIAFDKRQKEVRTVLGLPLDGPVVEYHDVAECKPVEVKRRSMFSRIFG